MAGRARLQVGSGQWIAEERSSAANIAQSEVEEFTFSVRNDFDWLNEHMAEVFGENQINVAEIFKTPGKLRGKTPRTVRKDIGENRVPLSNIFSSTPKHGPSLFPLSNHGRPNTPRVKIAVDPQPSPPKVMAPTSPLKQTVPSNPVAPMKLVDSGYHGSQSQDVMDIDHHDDIPDEATQPFSQPLSRVPSSPGDAHLGRVTFDVSDIHEDPESPVRPTHPSPDADMEPGQAEPPSQNVTTHSGPTTSSPTKKLVHHESTTPAGSPAQPSFDVVSSSPMVAADAEESHTPSVDPPAMGSDGVETALDETPRSPSDGSSPIPIRPIVRKSSLNFASLPAREPITHKSIGNRVSRTSHLDQNRPSYYRHTGGKSLGHAQQDLTDDENDDMEVDEFPLPPKAQPQVEVENAVTHSKTYTQRLQDQISKLGKTQVNVQQAPKPVTDSTASQSSMPPPPTPAKQSASPKKMATTPGAFPEDDDDWTQTLGTPDDASNFKSPRPGLPKSHTADVMEGVSGKDTVSAQDFTLPKQRLQTSYLQSPQQPTAGEGANGHFGHHKSISVPTLPVGSYEQDENNLKKAVSVSNPALAPVFEDGQPATPKTPSRGFNNSPLKQVKNKLSSILKSSRGLLASSAAISAEGKSSLLSPSTTRLGLHPAPSTETFRSPSAKDTQPLYPDLSRQMTDTQTVAGTASQDRPEGRKTRASIERDKAEEKRKKEEAKEAKRMAEQMEKLEKAREKEREKARVFSKEQERLVAMEKQVAAQKEQEKRAAIATPGNIPKTTGSSPRKTTREADSDDQEKQAATVDDKLSDDAEMVDAPTLMPPPSVPRPTAPPSAMKAREIKRPVRPTKEPAAKAKQAPTVIRVNMGSQHPGFHPSNNTLAAGLQDSLSQPQMKGKASQPSLQTKQSMQSLKSSTSSSGRPKALEAAARRKEQEEREAQRKREAKAEMERKRAAIQEEERRQEQQRKLEAERQREEERRQAAAQAEAKKNAQRQAMLEKAKQTRAPPPAVRSQPGGPPDYGRMDAIPARPPSRMGSVAPDSSRPMNSMLSNGAKAQTKRPLPQEPNDDASRTNQMRTANNQPKESKRMRMTDELNDPAQKEKQPNLKGAPVRPSGGFKKDLPTKSMFAAGYTNAPQNSTRDLFKATVTSQHNSHIKPAHPLDMAQLSKGAIPFATNTHAAAGPSKTPGRPMGVAGVKSAAKSATRSSPRFQNGESIELPEINTEDEDDDDDDDDDHGGKSMIADWADSPNLRRALVEQENKNPFDVFGPPAPLNMEEVFARSKERFTKFRARTSSANWSGPDGLTEEDIRKDLAAREKMRREGGWSYDMGREMV
ncbi:hypothetical protein GGS20DRAFT_530693 [Poronia punctata]|nr:hypothetical protein GGS20DRAFT_530693 [Poronia punctata]